MKKRLLVRVKGGPGSGNYGHTGRPGMVGGSGGSGQLLSRLTNFYKNEEAGLPHTKQDLFSLAWDLADQLQDLWSESNAWKSDEADFNETVKKLRSNMSVPEYIVTIDTVVNKMHQSLLNADDAEGSEAMMRLSGGNLREYLLHREDSAWRESRQAELAKEEEFELHLQDLEDKYYEALENLFG